LISLGQGVDHFRLFGAPEFRAFDGGSEKDTWEFVNGPVQMEIRGIEDGELVFGCVCSELESDAYDTMYTGIEQIVATDPTMLDPGESNHVTSAKDNFDEPVFLGTNWALNGNVVHSTDSRFRAVELVNFDKFDAFAGNNAAQNYRFSVVSTVYPVEAHGFNRIEYGFSRNARTGDINGVQHDIDFTSVDGSVPKSIVISNYLGNEALDVEILNSELRGITPTRLDLNFIESLTIWGTDSGDDVFDVRPSNLRLAFYAAGGNDTLVTPANVPRSFTKQLSFIGGLGDDVLRVDDSEFTGDFGYRIRENWIRNLPDPRSDVSQFQAVWHREVENVSVEGTRGSNIFRVHPTDQFNLHVNGNNPDRGVADLLVFANGVTDYQTDLINQTITFDYASPVTFEEIEQVQGGDLIAVSSRAGGQAVVELHNTNTLETFNTILPYSNTLGVVAATGNVNGGIIPDLVVGTTESRSRVRVFDGDTGRVLAQFFPFDSTDGVDIAVGNVMGSPDPELIVSQLNGGNEVRVFQANFDAAGELTYTLARSLTPFADAPDVGVRVALGDFDYDNFSDIVSVPANGWLPQVAVHSVVDDVTQLQRFLAHDTSYRSGLNVSVGNLIGNPKSDIVVNFQGTDSNTNMVRTFRGERLFRNSGQSVLSPDRELRLFGGKDMTNVFVYDIDGDRDADTIFAMAGGETSNGRVRVLDTAFESIDSFSTDEGEFLNGGDLG
jgi:hypothetical protein